MTSMNDGSPEDFLSDSLQTLYDYTPITHSSAGSVFRYEPSEEIIPTSSVSSAITLITPTTQAANWSLHASSIWASSIYVADHLLDMHLAEHLERARTEGRQCLRVLELGAGAGLPSILIAKTYENVEVTASDYPDEELIKTLRDNVERNDVGQRCNAVPYAWGSDTFVFAYPAVAHKNAGSSTKDDCTFDIVIAADTLWNSQLHPLFLDALQRTLRRSANARIYLVAGLHTGRYTLQAFMDLVHEYGLDFAEITEKEVKGAKMRPWCVGRHNQEDEKERRRWVLWMVLRWKDDILVC
jgi:EEF1A N-terminal glycine/lysine methyltransferase